MNIISYSIGCQHSIRRWRQRSQYLFYYFLIHRFCAKVATPDGTAKPFSNSQGIPDKFNMQHSFAEKYNFSTKHLDIGADRPS